MAQKLSMIQLGAGTIIGTEGTDHNPLPTSIADSPSSSVTFSLPVACYIYITFGCRAQVNTNLTINLNLNIDNSDVKGVQFTNPTAGQLYADISRTYKATLAAGSHTIKLRGVATLGSAAVNIAPYWYGQVVAQ